MPTKKRTPITMRAAIFTVIGGGVFVLLASILTPLIEHWLEQPPIVPTLIQSPTPIIATDAGTIVPTDSIPSPTTTWTPIPSLTAPAATTIFEDTFIDNRNQWAVESSSSYIVAGKYTINVDCPASYDSFYCGTYIRIPFAFPKNFRMEIDTAILESSSEADIALGFQARRNGSNHYYIMYFIQQGFYQLNVTHDGNRFSLIPETSTDLIVNELGATNRIGIEINEILFTPILNGQKMAQVEDGTLTNPGESYILIFVSRGHSAKIQLGNLTIQEPR